MDIYGWFVSLGFSKYQFYVTEVIRPKLEHLGDTTLGEPQVSGGNAKRLCGLLKPTAALPLYELSIPKAA